MSWYQKGKTNVDFTEARDSEWQWYQLGHMQVCTSLQTDKHASTPPLSFLQAGCPSCRPTNSVKTLKAKNLNFKKTTCYLFSTSASVRLPSDHATLQRTNSVVSVAADMNTLHVSTTNDTSCNKSPTANSAS